MFDFSIVFQLCLLLGHWKLNFGIDSNSVPPCMHKQSRFTSKDQNHWLDSVVSKLLKTICFQVNAALYHKKGKNIVGLAKFQNGCLHNVNKAHSFGHVFRHRVLCPSNKELYMNRRIFSRILVDGMEVAFIRPAINYILQIRYNTLLTDISERQIGNYVNIWRLDPSISCWDKMHAFLSPY